MSFALTNKYIFLNKGNLYLIEINFHVPGIDMGVDCAEILTLFPTKGSKFTNKEEFLLSLYLTKNVNVNFSAIIFQKQNIDFPILELTLEEEAEMSTTKLSQIIE